ncbi:NAD(P)/FAD-dependent oxidoreductase [Cryptosporangium phraense]|uniref:FAD-dependent oxidoreductase n=1 Tax=Cryptosporangium phraense TaxID=2593070 RepID=A0A545AX64_9ACTN|nr:FAD-dependent oxidoreductase [Cryptosporangium phraense]TQS45922.1 FAD-dependent oxidoreductase [Cryptosporangium phraense]
MHEIVVLGAGYSGLSATTGLAGRLGARSDVRITVVNPGERFTERLRLHQVAAGQQVADLRIPDLLRKTGVRLVPGWVTAVDADARTVRIDDERELAYDTLVYALGAVADTAAVPGADEHAYTVDNARLFAERLPGKRTVAVCGTGLTGIEAATELAESHPGLTVTLVGRDEPGARLGPKAKAHLDRALDRLGIHVRRAEIVAIDADGVTLADGHLPADAVLWTSGVRVSPLAAKAGLDVDERGRIRTGPTLRSLSHPDVVAIGDAAAIRQSYGVLHGTCQSGMPTGAYAAWAIARALAGKPVKPFRFGYLHVPISLGRRDAVVQFTHPDDSPKRLALTGGLARWYKETVSGSPWPTLSRTAAAPKITMLGWRRGGRYTR